MRLKLSVIWKNDMREGKSVLTVEHSNGAVTYLGKLRQTPPTMTKIPSDQRTPVVENRMMGIRTQDQVVTLPALREISPM